MKVRNPRTGKEDYEIAPPASHELARTTQRLRKAQAGWASRSAEERAAALLRLAEAIERRADTLAEALTTDTGRRRISRIEVEGTASLMRRWAGRAPELIKKAAGAARLSAVPGIELSSALRPYPLIGVISPWNFPLTLALIDTVPALAAGCAVLVKPSEVTPRFIQPLRAAIAEVPDLASVLEVVVGGGATGAALISLTDYVCFTGSVATGHKVAAAAAQAMIPSSLELGGKDPMIVLKSADPDWAADVALRASIVNAGQACQSIERIYVADAIAEPFLDALVRKAKAARLNHPDIASGDLGPFIFAGQARIVAAQLADAAAKGALILSGGKIEKLDGGLYLEPTVLRDVTHDMAVMREETFGPVLPVMTFQSPDEGVALANDSRYGLSAAVLAGSVEEAEDVARRLDAGAVSINDASLTAMVWDAEKSSFGESGLGPTRMGDAGLLRFFRRQAFIRQTGTALPLAAYSEDAA